MQYQGIGRVPVSKIASDISYDILSRKGVERYPMTETSHLGTGRQPMAFELSSDRTESRGICLDITLILLEWDNPQDQYSETNVMHFLFNC
jgi:hypothetical protein